MQLHAVVSEEKYGFKSGEVSSSANSNENIKQLNNLSNSLECQCAKKKTP